MSEPFPALIIRPYIQNDRASISRICADTANRGRPIETFFAGREIFADLMLSCYLDYEPASCWIAEVEGEAVGYLTGCLSSRRYDSIMSRRIIPKVFLKACQRGVFFLPSTWRLVRTGFKNWRSGGFRKRIPYQLYPAHCHVNVKAGFRGRQIGQKLLEKFIEQVKAARLPGIHLVTREDNEGACRFFEKRGFLRLSRHKIIFLEGERELNGYTVVYGKKL